ncbi:ribonuclease H-like domain-containing protein [Candidatus Sumerlaeota bacterium]|nr:ribonuclease H-like domain-containing protein [Candidatus Sumerlaeota bacterium]
MDLRKKLDRLKEEKCEALLKQLGGSLRRASELPAQDDSRAAPARNPDLKTISAAELAALPRRKPTRSANLPGVEAMFPDGRMIEGETGAVFHRCTRLSPGDEDHPRGYAFASFEGMGAWDADALVALTNDPEASIELEGWAFIDVETTGLGGGTGAFAFLVGVGYFADGGFTVEQFFMPDFPDERALLEAVAERMRDFRALVTYNGKGFDAPLLRSRFLLHRLRSAWEKPHWDLLHTCRRIWKRRLRDCSLGNIELEALGHAARSSDIPGAEIPAVYFDYVRGARRERMRKVFDHHAQDILSLGALALRLLRIWRNAGEELAHADDLTGLAGMHESRRDWAREGECLERALLLERRPDAIYELSLRVAQCYKRQRRWNEAAEVWRAQMANSACPGVRPHVELAKYLEHRERRFEEALTATHAALRWVEGWMERRGWVQDGGGAEGLALERRLLLRRLARLERKQQGMARDAS